MKEIADHKEIADAYQGGLSMGQCMEKFGVVKGTVRHALKKYGVPTRAKVKRINIAAPRSNYRKEPERFLKYEAPEPVAKVHPVREEILKYAVKACENFGGMASIDGRYAIVDTTLCEVKRRGE